MDYIFLVCIFIIGCCIASFINVLIYRLPLGISVSKGRSFCPHCHHQLYCMDLFPIISYLCLLGKCRYCHQKISKCDTVIELLGGFFGLFCYFHYGLNVMTIIIFCFGMVLLAISIIDLRTMIIPDCLVLSCFFISLLSIPFTNLFLLEHIIGFFIVSIPLYMMTILIPDCFGGGDIKLIAVCGLFIGWKYLLIGMVIAIMLAGMYASYLLIRQKAKVYEHMAFAPYICLGVLFVLFYGEQLSNYYFYIFI